MKAIKTQPELTLTKNADNSILFQYGEISCLFQKNGERTSDYRVQFHKNDKKGHKIFDAFIETISKFNKESDKTNQMEVEMNMMYIGFLQILTKYVTK